MQQKRVYCLYRVSTVGQVEKDDIPMQREYCRNFVSMHSDWTIEKELLEKVQAGTNVLFDLSKMVHIDATGLGVLVQVLQKVKADNGKVILAGLQEGPKIVFDITNVSHVFEIVPTLKDAKF